jgi:hypothetical protein
MRTSDGEVSDRGGLFIVSSTTRFDVFSRLLWTNFDLENKAIYSPSMTDLERYRLWGSTEAAMDSIKYEDNGHCLSSAHMEDVEGSAHYQS